MRVRKKRKRYPGGRLNAGRNGGHCENGKFRKYPGIGGVRGRVGEEEEGGGRGRRVWWWADGERGGVARLSECKKAVKTTRKKRERGEKGRRGGGKEDEEGEGGGREPREMNGSR